MATVTLQTNNGATLTGTVTLRATVTGDTKGFSSATLYINNVARGTSDLPILFTFNTTVLQNGSYPMYVVAKIKGVNYPSNTITVVISNGAVGSITQSITPGEVLNATETWTATLANITGATGVTFMVDGVDLTPVDLTAPYSYSLDTTQWNDGSHSFQVRVRDGAGVDYYSTPVTATITNVAGAAPVNTVTPTLSTASGIAVVGEVVTATQGTWTGEPTPQFSYQWLRCDSAGANCVAIPFATNLAYTITSADVGYRLKCRITATNASAPSGVIAYTPLTIAVTQPGGSLPVNTVAPAISGTAQQDQTLTASSTWTGATGGVAYQWFRYDAQGNNPVLITGATATTYVLTSSDIGSRIGVRATGTNASGSVSAYSPLTVVVAALQTTVAPSNTSPPTITTPSGSALVGEVVTLNPGTWSGTPTPQVSAQVRSCSPSAPFATVLDTFNRANENPLSQSGAWTTMAGLNPMKIVSNQLVGSANWSCSYRGSYTDVEAAVQLGVVATTSDDFEIILRLRDGGGVSPIRASNQTGYGFTFDGKDNYEIYRYVNGAYALIKARTAWSGGVLSDGDWVGCRVIGSTLEVWCKRGSGAWTKEFTMTDLQVTGAGAISLGGESTVSTFDNFSGGAATATSTVCTDLVGYTGNTYTIRSSDVGNFIRFRVTAQNSAGTATLDSPMTVAVTSNQPPPPPPPVQGTTYVLVDHETGNLSQWHGGIVNAQAWQVVSSDGGVTPAKGNFFAKITVPPTAPDAPGWGAEAGTRGAPPPDNQWSNDRWPMSVKLANGVTDYFSFSWLFPTNWPGATTSQANAGLTQLGFNGLANTTLQIHNQSPISNPAKTPGSLELTMLTGRILFPGEGTFPDPGTSTFTSGQQTYEFNTENQGLGPYYTGYKIVPEARYALGVWHLVVLAVKWAPGFTGRVQAWHKRKGVDSGWTQTLDVPNVPTFSWGHAATGTTNAGNYEGPNGIDKFGQPWQHINKVGPYFGGLMQTRIYYMDTFAISTSLAAAQAALE